MPVYTLANGKDIQIDEADLPLLAGRRWTIHQTTGVGTCYAMAEPGSRRKRGIALHQLILGKRPAGATLAFHDGDRRNLSRANIEYQYRCARCGAQIDQTRGLRLQQLGLCAACDHTREPPRWRPRAGQGDRNKPPRDTPFSPAPLHHR